MKKDKLTIIMPNRNIIKELHDKEIEKIKSIIKEIKK